MDRPLGSCMYCQRCGLIWCGCLLRTFVREANEKDDWAMVSAEGGIVNANTIYYSKGQPRGLRADVCSAILWLHHGPLTGQGAGGGCVCTLTPNRTTPAAITIAIKPRPGPASNGQMGLGQRRLDFLSTIVVTNCSHDCDQRHCRAERNASCSMSTRPAWLSGGWAESLMHSHH